MKRMSALATVLLSGSLVLALSASDALAQSKGGAGKGQGQNLRLRDGSCGTTPQAQRDQTQLRTRDQLRDTTQDQLRTRDRLRSRTTTQ
jgi:hypothetical protein